MSKRFANLPRPIARPLRAFYRRVRLFALLRLAFGCAAYYLAAALVVMHADRFLFLEQPTRLLLTRLVHATAALAALAGLAVLAWRRPTARQIAYQLEARLLGRADERYVTLESLLARPQPPDPNPVHRELLAQLEAAAAEQSRTVHGGLLVRDARLRAASWLCAALFAACALLMLNGPYEFALMTRRFLAPAANLPKPSFMHIRITPEHVAVGKGTELVLQAQIEGAIPAPLRWLLVRLGADPSRCLLATAPGRPDELRVTETAERMTRIQRHLFVFAFPELGESFSFRIRCGDALTDIRFADVIAQPRLTSVELEVTPPPYSGLPVEVIRELDRPVRLLPGTRAALRFVTDQPVTTRQILDVKRTTALDAEWDEATRTGTHSFEVREAVELEVRVVNARGFANVDRTRLSIGVREDRAPTVRLDEPGEDLQRVPGELVALRGLIEDDLGLAEVAIQYQLNPTLNPDAPVRELPLESFTNGAARLALAASFDLAQTGAAPGDEVLMQVRARDSGDNDGRSRPVLIRVTAFTRGENERRRLVAMASAGSVCQALTNAANVRLDGLALDPESYALCREAARAQGIELDEDASVGSLLDLLEREHHFTDAPRAKQDLCELHGLLQAAATLPELLAPPPTPGAAASAAGRTPAAARSACAAHVAQDLIPGLTDYRRLKNLTWRFFGMRDEIEHIRAGIEALDHRESVDRAAREAALVALGRIAAEKALAAPAGRDAVSRYRALEQRLQQARDAVSAKAEEINALTARGAAVEDIEKAEEELEGLREDLAAQGNQRAGEHRNLQAVMRTFAAQALQAGHAEIGDAARLLPDDATCAALVTDVFLAALQAQGADAAKPDLAALSRSATARLLPQLGDVRVDAAEPLKRRATLYLKSLEELGSELIALARQAPGLDPDRITALQGELTTAAYYINRGASSRRAAACEQVAARLTDMLVAARPALLTLFVREQAARADLDARHAALRDALVAQTPRDAGQHRAIMAWLSSQSRLLGCNPFAPFESRYRNLCSSPAPAALSAAMAREAELSRRLALRWEAADVLAFDRISNAERQMAVTLCALEADPTAARSGFSAVLALNLASNAAPAPRLPASLAQRPPLTTNDWNTLATALAPLGARLGPDLGFVTNGLPLLAALDARIEEFAEGAGSGDQAAQAEVIERDLAAAVFAIERGLDLLFAAVTYGAPLDPAVHRYELLLLRMRDPLRRYEQTVPAALAALGRRARSELNAADLSELANDCRAVRQGTHALLAGLEKTLAEFHGAGDAQAPAAAPDPLAESLTRSRLLLEAALQIEAAPRPAPLVGAFLTRVPEAAQRLLADRAARLDAAQASLAAAELALKGEPVDLTRYAGRAAEAGADLAEFADAAARAGETASRAGLDAEAAELVSRARLLAPPNDKPDSVEIRRRLYAISDLRKQAALAAKARALVEAHDDGAGWGGGPAAIWEPGLRYDADRSRERVRGQASYAEQTVILGLLAGLDESPDRAVLAAAADWSRLNHRLVRSPLSGASGARARRADGSQGANPLLTWLLGELEEGRKETRREGALREYQDVTRELFETMSGFLRY